MCRCLKCFLHRALKHTDAYYVRFILHEVFKQCFKFLVTSCPDMLLSNFGSVKSLLSILFEQTRLKTLYILYETAARFEILLQTAMV